jgi:DNA-directed RNA polymerase subunit RPC12/RpoP
MSSHKIQHELQGEVLSISIEGVFDESVDLDEIIGDKSLSEVNFELGSVKRINSSGVRKWLLFLQTHHDKFKIHVQSAPPCVVEQMNLIAGFLQGVKVQSIYLPYVCNQCDHEHMEKVASADFEKLKTELPVVACSNCENPDMEFDYLTEEYLYFLSQST